MISVVLPLLGLAALGAAQSSTVSLFMPFLPVPADPPSLVASIVGSDSTATTYVVDCAPTPTASAAVSAAASTSSSDSATCGFGSALTIVEGPSTVLYTVTYAAIFTETVDCVLSGTTYASCTGVEPVNISFGLNVASGTLSNSVFMDSSSMTIIDTGSAAETEFVPVVITAGAAKAKPASGVSATATGATSTVTGTATSKGSTSKTSSAGAVSQTGNAAVGGAPGVGAGLVGAFGVAVAGALL